jgi:glycosyltransferase involved in cell wall biosynthesis
MDVSCETLAFPAAVRSFGENRQVQVARAAGRAWHKILAKVARLAGWLRAGAGVLIYGWRLRRRLGQLGPDVLHSNGMKMHLLGALAKGATPLVWHLHDYLSARPAMKPLLRRLASRCQLLIANSESVAADARRVLPGSLPVHVVYNAVDSEVFTPEGAALDLDALAGLPAAALGTVRAGLVATFAFWKGHEVFLRAAAACEPANPIRFYVIGGPVYATGGSQYSLEQLKSLANELGVANRVGFTGFVEDVPAAMRALDIVVHASTEPEPFGLVIVQAMACGRAVIVSAAGGACELVEPETNALTHTPGEIGGLADALMGLATDAALRIRLGTAGRVNVRRDFSRLRMAEVIVPLYEKAAATSQ